MIVVTETFIVRFYIVVKPSKRRKNETTLCLKKAPTFKLSVTLSNLNQFSKFLHCWKVYELCYKSDTTLLTSP